MLIMATESVDLDPCKTGLNESQSDSLNMQLMTQRAEMERAYNDQSNIMLYLHQTEIANLKEKHMEQLKKRENHICALESQLEDELLLQNVEVDGLTGSLEEDVEFLKRRVAHLRQALKKQQLLLDTSSTRDSFPTTMAHHLRNGMSISGSRRIKDSVLSQENEWSSDDDEPDCLEFESATKPLRSAWLHPPVARSSSSLSIHGLHTVPESEAMNLSDDGAFSSLSENHKNTECSSQIESRTQQHGVLVSRSCIVSWCARDCIYKT